MFSKAKERPLPPIKKDPQMNQDRNLPAIHDSPVEAFAPRGIRNSRLSEQAAMAAQQMHDLLGELDALRVQIAQLQSHVQVLEESIQIVQVERDNLVIANERLMRENSMIHTRVNVAAETLMALRRPVEEPQEAEPPKQRAEVPLETTDKKEE